MKLLKSQKVYSFSEIAWIVDNYFYKRHGFGPHRAKAEKEEAFRNLIGYNKEPSWLFPELRNLLPKATVLISQEGTFHFGGFRYQGDFLTHWKNQIVSLRIPPGDPPENIWVYEDEEVISFAHRIRGARQG